MKTIAAVLAFLLVALAVSDDQVRPVPKGDGEGQGQGGQDASDQETTPRETKEQKAQEALEKAKQAHSDAVHQAEQNMKGLEVFVRSSHNGRDVDETLKEANALAAQAMAEKMGEADKALKERLSALSQPPANGTSIDELEHEASKAADRVQKVHTEQARALRKILAGMEKKAKEQARGLGKQTKRSAGASLKAARDLERAMHRAGVKEREYEGLYDQNEGLSERAQDRAEDLADEAEDAIERFYGRVEGAEERATHQLLQQTGAQLKQAVAEALEAGKRARSAAEEHAEPAARGEDKADDEKSGDKPQEDAAADDEESSDSGASGTPEQAVGMAARAGSPPVPASPVVLFFGILFFLSAAAPLAFSLFLSRRQVREAPLLLG